MRAFHISKCIAGRMAGIATVILLLVVAANAYTVVMHGGRRVEIPSRFVVTPATLTYEVTEGIQITIAMAAIDIPATEKANNEQPGSLLARATADPKVGIEKPSSSARRTLTNRDLETLKRRRLESETAYERRRAELGLPSLAEARKRAAAEFDLVTAELGQKRIAEKQSEDYWRQRAETLRTEMAALDAELNYLRTRLDELPFRTSFAGSGGSFIGGIGFGFRGTGNFGSRTFGTFGSGRPSHGQVSRRPGVFVAPNYGPQITDRFGVSRSITRGQVFVNPGAARHPRQIGGGATFGILPNAPVFGLTDQGYDFTYERSELISRFNALAAARAGLNARWRELEEEARRAGVSPGLLRP